MTTIADGADTVATLTSPATHTRPVGEKVLSEALAAIGWEPNGLDPDYPPHVAFAGNDHLVLGVTSLVTLDGLDYDFDRLADLMRKQQWTTAHLFFPAGDGVFHVRNPFRPAASSRTLPPGPRRPPSVATCAPWDSSGCPRS